MRIGIDLGGSKIEAVALAADNSERLRRRVATPQGDYLGTLDAITRLINQIETELDCSASIGIGIPGAISALTGRIKNANSTCLIGQALDQDLQKRLSRPVRIANDADCFALSEASDGAAAGAPTVFGVIVGTGVGGGLVINGELLSGANRIAGEWGHNPLPWAGDDDLAMPCYCGLRGCIETYLSGPGLCHHYEQAGGQPLTRVEELVQRAEQSEPLARRLLERYYEWLAKGLAGVINVLDPAVIVLGGGLSNMRPLYTEVPARWQRYVFSDRVDTRLLPARHGDSSGVRGAAWLWPHSHSGFSSSR
ncbi:ROK family protein [Motiliproteus sediminis]|uniref:ROK family protein n=1 Tax=Motiliproteus sediminis TaxID=1468178 RepID=UPI001AF01AB3|nr:ROK family protein [Motiliproteus sediminis]